MKASFLFAFCLCVVCSLLLTLSSQGLKPLQETNRQLDRQKNILQALGIMPSKAKWEKTKIRVHHNRAQCKGKN